MSMDRRPAIWGIVDTHTTYATLRIAMIPMAGVIDVVWVVAVAYLGLLGVVRRGLLVVALISALSASGL